ncbi:MAG TPA: Asp-tRNA(Asn)/Glu-tRNA(Gln) amidotransferase subunit GatC [Terriglobia bacterium]|nr:Asp-tRNA(Asn)/Glu-tRNA(Gln) amidotransferase subunit GatC [Terriglobia bacterium]
MALTEKEVRYVAELAHLKLSDEEVKRFMPQLDSILEYIAKLAELDLGGMEPMAQVLSEGAAGFALRPDVSRPMFTPAVALANAPEPGPGFFKVPRVIEKE